jgi:hypothetical protein
MSTPHPQTQSFSTTLQYHTSTRVDCSSSARGVRGHRGLEERRSNAEPAARSQLVEDSLLRCHPPHPPQTMQKVTTKPPGELLFYCQRPLTNPEHGRPVYCTCGVFPRAATLRYRSGFIFRMCWGQRPPFRYKALAKPEQGKTPPLRREGLRRQDRSSAGHRGLA